MAIPENQINKVKYESDQLDQLYTSLCKAQSEMEIAITDSVNPFFKSKYSDLASITKASRPYLTKNGLAIIQRIVSNGDDKMYLLTRLCHMSGQWIESKMPISPQDNKIQSIGSYITYVRRYALSAIIGIAVDDANDDDGEKAMSREDKKEKNIKMFQNDNEPISDQRVSFLKTLVKKMPEESQIEEIDKIFEFHKIKDFKFLKNKNFEAVHQSLKDLIEGK